MRIKLTEFSKDSDIQGYAVLDISKPTMPVVLGYMEYSYLTGTWFVYRIRTQEHIYRTCSRILTDMQWVYKIFTKKYRNFTGYR